MEGYISKKNPLRNDSLFIKSHNPRVADPNPFPATCFLGSEIRLPQGYTKGRRPETLAFLRSIASSGNDLRRGGESLCGEFGLARESRRPDWLGDRGLFWTKTLGRLKVSRCLGYRVLRALNGSQPLHYLPMTLNWRELAQKSAECRERPHRNNSR